jgi:hypothetical protein
LITAQWSVCCTSNLQFLDAWGIIIAQGSWRSDRIEMRFLSSSVCARVFDTTWSLFWLISAVLQTANLVELKPTSEATLSDWCTSAARVAPLVLLPVSPAIVSSSQLSFGVPWHWCYSGVPFLLMKNRRMYKSSWKKCYSWVWACYFQLWPCFVVQTRNYTIHPRQILFSALCSPSYQPKAWVNS